jgi:predicted MFS family arabinose efflux permease
MRSALSTLEPLVNSASPRVAFLRSYAGLLGRGDVRRLIAGSMIGRLPSAMLPLAILLMVHERTHSLAAAGLVVGAYGIGRAAISPLAGAMVDRVGQARVLSIGVAAQALLLAALVIAAQVQLPLLLTCAVAAAAGAASPPIQACLRALWPVVASGDQERDAAYSFDATTQELLWIAGPLLVAALLSAVTPAGVVIISAVIGGVGVALFATSPISRGWRAARGVERVRYGALAGRNLRALLVTGVLSGWQWGALTFGVTALAVALGSSRASGLLLACISVGSITGGLTYGARAWRRSVSERYRVLLAATVACGIPLLFAGSIAVAAPLGLLAGLPLAATYASMYILTGRSAPGGTTTEAFTWTSAAFALGVSLGTAGAGALSQTAGVHSAFAMACLAAGAAALLAFNIRDSSTAS